MKPFFSRNIDNRGGLVREMGALVWLAGAGFGFTVSVWLGLLAPAVFVGFEPLLGWCVMRACRIKIRL